LIRAVLWVIACLLLLLSAMITLGNAGVVLRWMLQRKRSSFLPVVGGFWGMVGVLVLPLKGSAKWCWIPLIADLGSAPMLVFLILTLFRKENAN